MFVRINLDSTIFSVKLHHIRILNHLIPMWDNLFIMYVVVSVINLLYSFFNSSRLVGYYTKRYPDTANKTTIKVVLYLCCLIPILNITIFLYSIKKIWETVTSL